ncbi:AraC-like DNA-binding protein [Saonia flava]|uniref:AraC-like DNA-binding protein n=1 Tax=Saonia flava TaxID=523696 RepID=A0A846QX35_9FLAO|nr:AraC family transcriptional regulator [Saonia flava]NJB72518.1 AraC-like DNA-binding protein [Saonia flava]
MRLQIYLSLLSIFLSNSVTPHSPQDKIAKISITKINPSTSIVLINADKFYHEQKFSEALTLYEQIESNHDENEAHVLKKMALSHAALLDSIKSADYIEQYLMADFKTSFLEHEGFAPIKNTQSYRSVVKKYVPKVSIWSFLYFYVAMIGFFIVTVLNFNKKIDAGAKILIGGFVFIHSFFILHISLNITNYQYQFPHSYLMSTCFSFLYGPLLYFYFKRITQEYKFKTKDLLHLIPTLLFLIYIIPIYSMSGAAKLELMLNRVRNGLNPSDSAAVSIIVALKWVSLVIYGFHIRKLYLKSKENKDLDKKSGTWQRNIYGIHLIYIVCYTVYGLLISNNISSGFFYHSQIVTMAIMVLYVGYSANVQPKVFNGVYSYGNNLIFKYEKSGLTESLSYELKESLINLFDVDKIYRENQISLDVLSDRLNTTRHNTSQVINEHFNMSFHELVNKYRIQEAKEIMSNDYNRNLNIIDIAYEVGYNNKVTFNKAFKKDTLLTPSEYQRTFFQPQM